MSDIGFPGWVDRSVRITIALLLFLLAVVFTVGLMEPLLHWDVDSFLDQNFWLVVSFSIVCLSSSVGILLVWGMMLWHWCYRLKPSTRTPRWIWLVVILLGNFFGALLYYFVVKNHLLRIRGTH